MNNEIKQAAENLFSLHALPFTDYESVLVSFDLAIKEATELNSKPSNLFDNTDPYLWYNVIQELEKMKTKYINEQCTKY